VLPIFPDLRTILLKMQQHADGRFFHGPRGGVVKPDTIRNVLRRDVLDPLSERFPAVEGRKSFRDGRIHSFRHYFCSVAATSGVPEQMLMKWLGYADSRMVRHYFHLHDASSQKQMASVPFLGEAKAKNKAEGEEE
jgi:integrase